MSWLNVGSLLLGLVSWALPIMGIIKKRSLSDTHHILLVLSSMGAALLAVFFQLLYNWYLVSIEVLVRFLIRWLLLSLQHLS